MRLISNQIRIGRFSVKSDADIHITVQKKAGGSSRFKVVNVSPGGLAAMGTASESDDIGLAVGDIIPGSRLRFLHHDLALGRVICRYITNSEGRALCGFSLVDFPLPLDGPISRLLNGYAPKSDRPYPSDPDPDRLSRANIVRTAEANRQDLSDRARRFLVHGRRSAAR